MPEFIEGHDYNGNEFRLDARESLGHIKIVLIEKPLNNVNMHVGFVRTDMKGHLTAFLESTEFFLISDNTSEEFSLNEEGLKSEVFSTRTVHARGGGLVFV